MIVKLKLFLFSILISASSLSFALSDAAISRQHIVRDFDTFRDQILAKVGKKNSEPTPLRNYDISESVDTDGDGLADYEDPYPLDGTRPFYAGLIATGSLNESSWVNGSAQVGSRFGLSIRNDSSFDISLSEFLVLDASQNVIGYTDDPSYLGEDGFLSVDENTGLTFTLNDEAVESAIYLIYYYINPEDLTSEYVGVVFTETQSIPFASYALDTDADGIDNDGDNDDDGDGVNDLLDAFPVDASEQSDSDGDGVGDNSDWAPEDSSESVDTDGDGIGNNADSDDDGDGVPDLQDDFPLKNTETTDSDGDGIGDNDEARAQLVATDVLINKMISYAGLVATESMEDMDEIAGESDSWTLARGESVSQSTACANGGGYDSVLTRTGWTTLSATLDLENCIEENNLRINGSVTFTYDDSLWEQQTPRESYPFIFTFSNLSIRDAANETFRYSGALSCDFDYNSVAESWTYKNEGENRVWEGRWGSVFDELNVAWDQNYLGTNDQGNTHINTVYGIDNCDFNNVAVTHRSLNHTIVSAKYLSQPYGTGYNISEYTRSERLLKAQNKQVFYRETYIPENGWSTEINSRFDRNPVIRLADKGNFSLNVYSSRGTYNYALRENVDDIIFQDVQQFSELDWVYLDPITDKISAAFYRYERRSFWDYDNDGVWEIITVPWAISRLGSVSECDTSLLRYDDWIVASQSTATNPNGLCLFDTGFDVYDGEVWYQDTNLDGHNELFTLDDDNDGVLDAEDNCQAVANVSQVDTDNDSLGNACDKDDDGDGVLDSQDAFPLDNTETSDSDLDGVGDNSDWAPNDSSESVDTDGDGVGDNADAFPTDATETLDTDGDGDGDNTDVDIDGDGVLNDDDPFPMQGQYTADSDSDGMPDSWETKYGLDPNDPSDATSDQDNDGVTALDEFLAGTIPSGSLDIDGNENYDALTDGLLLLRGMFGLDGSALVTGTIASDAAYTESVDIESRIEILGDLADIDGNGDIDALTDGLLILRYLFGLQGDTLINGVVAEDATRKTAEEIEAHLETLMPAL